MSRATPLISALALIACFVALAPVMAQEPNGASSPSASPPGETSSGAGDMMEFLKSSRAVIENWTIAGNPIWRIAALFLAILGGWIGGRVIRFLLNSTAKSLEKRDRRYSAATLQSLAKAVVPAALVVGLDVGLQFLVLVPAVESAAQTIISVLFTLAAGYAVWCLVDVVNVWLLALADRTESKLDDMLAPMICTSLRVTVIVLVLVQVATVVSDKPMTSVIAGLGVGGLAIGLAAQDMIKNFFGSIMIFSDRPFEMGDRIQVGSFDGTVEIVGFRSTRIRTLDGHLVTIPNGTLANDSIRNVAKRPNIKRGFNIGVTYDTTPEKVQEAIDILKDILKDHEGQNADMPARIYFTDFADSSLTIAVTYWYHPANWWDYSAFSERVNMEIFKRFNAAGIEFAFPSQTIYLAGGGSDAPELSAAG
jgi:MscS family membrane protein